MTPNGNVCVIHIFKHLFGQHEEEKNNKWMGYDTVNYGWKFERKKESKKKKMKMKKWRKKITIDTQLDLQSFFLNFYLSTLL